MSRYPHNTLTLISFLPCPLVSEFLLYFSVPVRIFPCISNGWKHILGWVGAEELLTCLEPQLASKTINRDWYHETQTVDSNGRGLNPRLQNGIRISYMLSLKKSTILYALLAHLIMVS